MSNKQLATISAMVIAFFIGLMLIEFPEPKEPKVYFTTPDNGIQCAVAKSARSDVAIDCWSAK
jgi:hypothetical protein